VTDEKLGDSFPGDALIADADLTATRAISVRAPRDEVWPWIAQLGQGRGRFYTYDFVENLVGCDIHRADRLPEWQDLGVGDDARLAPRVGLAVAALEPGRSSFSEAGSLSGTGQPRTTSHGSSRFKMGWTK
jgi:hypothetical protein